MHKRSDILMIGSADRNVGKTLLACELIRRYAPTLAPVAVKITTIHEENGPCPRGGAGCGVCSSFEGAFCLTQVQDGPPNKDTTRLLDAGASKVFWLRVREGHLDEGITALLAQLPSGQPSIWESNSARQVLEPAAFLVLRKEGSQQMKESCLRVLGYADRILDFNGTGWNLSPDRIVFSSGRWTIRQDAAAIVLAGGQSRRMGQDKNFLPFHGRPMIEQIVSQLAPWFDDVLMEPTTPENSIFSSDASFPTVSPAWGL